MKHAKTAAVVAGSMMALGAAAPAFAGDAAAPSFSANGGLEKAVQSKTADAPQVDGVVGTVDGATKGGATKSLLGAEEPAPLLGGLPLG